MPTSGQIETHPAVARFAQATDQLNAATEVMDEAGTQRVACVQELHEAGWSFRAIGAALGISSTRAQQMDMKGSG